MRSACDEPRNHQVEERRLAVVWGCDRKAVIGTRPASVAVRCRLTGCRPVVELVETPEGGQGGDRWRVAVGGRCGGLDRLDHRTALVVEV